MKEGHGEMCPPGREGVAVGGAVEREEPEEVVMTEEDTCSLTLEPEGETCTCTCTCEYM